MVTAGILPFRENSHGRTGNRTRDLMISRQRLWPLDHEAGRNKLDQYAFTVIIEIQPLNTGDKSLNVCQEHREDITYQAQHYCIGF